MKRWSGRPGSNRRPTAWKAETLPLSYSRILLLAIPDWFSVLHLCTPTSLNLPRFATPQGPPVACRRSGWSRPWSGEVGLGSACPQHRRDAEQLHVHAGTNDMRHRVFRPSLPLQCYQAPGDTEDNLKRSMAARRKFKDRM